MLIPFYQIDAFANRPFSGNPAAVCLFDEWPHDELLQQIAAENNLSETAFLVPHGEGYELRWFTPSVEVELCGHATLASAWALFYHQHIQQDSIQFFTRYAGTLSVQWTADGLRMNFPLLKVKEDVDVPFIDQLTQDVQATAKADKLILQLAHEEDVRTFNPAEATIRSMHEVGVAVTASSAKPDIDFVSRFFAPNMGVPEDPVTGSLHCALADFWQRRLGKNSLTADQLSNRGGRVGITMQNHRVLLSGQCVTVIEGKMDDEASAGNS